MRFFKTRTRKLRERLELLENHLGLAYTKDEYGDADYVDREWGRLKQIGESIDALHKKKGKK